MFIDKDSVPKNILIKLFIYHFLAFEKILRSYKFVKKLFMYQFERLRKQSFL